MPTPPPDAEPNDLPPRVLLYDGHCALCHGTVRLLLRADAQGRLAFAPLHGRVAAAILTRHPDALATDSLLYVRHAGRVGEQVLARSDGALAAMDDAGGAARVLARVGRLLPRRLRDAIYDRIARSRYRVFGRYDECPLPPAHARDRFLS